MRRERLHHRIERGKLRVKTLGRGNRHFLPRAR